MENCRASVLLIGEADYHEFSDARRWLDENVFLSRANSVAEALDQSANRSDPWHSIIFAQARPGQFNAREIEEVGRAHPLAHLVALLGSWCEGESRSGRPWPGVVRVYWHQWRSRCESQLSIGLLPTSWQLPRTASETERTLHTMQTAASPENGLVVISTRRAIWFQGISQACREAGYASVWMTSESFNRIDGASAVLWDGQGLIEREWHQLGRIAQSAPEVPVIALLGFPRHDHVRLAHEYGAAAVLSSPFMVPDLWTTLHSVKRS